MNKFSVYMFKIFLKNLFSISMFIILLQFLSSAYGNLGSLEGYKYNILDFIILTSYGIILGINQLIPIIIAVTVLVTIIMLMKHNEMLAYMTIGGSIIHIAIPFLIIGSMLVIFMIYSEYYIIPKARVVREAMLDRMKNRPKKITHTYNNIWLINKNNTITHIELVSYTEKTLYNIQEYILNNHNQLIQINKIEKIKKENNIWTAYNIQSIKLSQNPPIYQIKEKETINNTTWDKLTNIKSTDIREYSPNELLMLIQLYKEKGINSNKLEITLYFKFASAVSVIILILILYPMSINFSRNYSIIKNASITFSIFLLFILIQHTFLSLGNNGVFPPIIAVFSPIIIFSIIGIIFIYIKNRPQ